MKYKSEKDNSLETKRELLPRTEKLFEALASLSQQQQQLSKISEDLKVQKENLVVLENRCSDRRRKIGKLLKTIYPITLDPTDPKRLVIGGLSIYKK